MGTAILPLHKAAEEAWMSINAVHVTAARERFGINLEGHNWVAAGERMV